MDGTGYFPVLFTAAERAEKSLLVISYILDDDEIGSRMLAILALRAQAGVRVRLILDGFGCADLRHETLRPLQDAGGEVLVYKPLNLRRKLLALRGGNALRLLLGRDHRKMVIVDGCRAFIGGINLSAKHTTWHDFMLDIRGPAASQAVRLFENSWSRENGRTESTELQIVPPPAGIQKVQILGNQIPRKYRPILTAYHGGLNAARREVIIANAYFLPDRKLQRQLFRAVHRGVRVRLLLPERSDVPVVQSASEYYYRRMMRKGVEIHLYGAGVLHAKVAVVDRRWLVVGSCNLDHQSIANNLELAGVVDDALMSEKLSTVLERDFAQARHLDPVLWRRRPFRKKLHSWWWHFFYRYL